MNRISKRLPYLVFVLAAALVACKGDGKSGEGSAKASTGAATPSEGAQAPPPSARMTLRSHRPLLQEAMRAELDVGGLLVDFGTADQHKYTRGGWATGWADPEPGELSTCAANFYHSKLDVVTNRPAAELVLRAKSPEKGQRIVLEVDGEQRGTADIGADWGEVRIALDPPLPPGRHHLDLEFRAGKKLVDRAVVDWLWLAEKAGAEPPTTVPRAAPIKVGGEPRRGLVAPSPRSYGFYLQVPDDASLVFDYGAPKAGTTFVVTAQTDGAEPAELFRGEAGQAWKEKAVDLAAYAGKPVRLVLATEGEGGGGWGEPEIMVAGEPAVTRTGGATAKNLIFILMDTARADAFSPFGAGDAETPAYDAFAREATVFVNAYNNENWTKPSVATTLSGLYPSSHDAKRDESKLPAEVTLLPQRLKKAGFATGGFVANGYISSFFGFEKGWDDFTNYIRDGKPSEAEHVYGDALAWLKDHKGERFFLYVQTIDPHVDYQVDETYWRRYFDGDYDGFVGDSVQAKDQVALSKGEGDDRDLAWVKALYWGEVTYHDEKMGEFLDQVKALGITDDTVIVITNDHGEELAEHGKLGHGHTLYEDMIRAPLTVRFPPRFAAGRRVSEIVEHVDLAPTLLELLGVAADADMDGVSLMPLVDGGPVRRPFYAVTEFLGGRRSLRVGDWKLIQTTDGARLFDVANDRAERKDLSDARPIARRLCEVHLGEGLGMPSKQQRAQDSVARRKFKAGKAKITPGMRRSLEALGYFGDH